MSTANSDAALPPPVVLPANDNLSGASETFQPREFAATAAGLWERRIVWLVLLALIGLQIAALWYFKYFPTTDGPSHVANADIMRSYYAPAGKAYRTYYDLQIKPMSNMLGHYLLAAMMLFLPALIAEKILVTLYIIALPLSARYAFEAIRRGSGFLAIVILPLAFGYLFHQGFYNFCLSTIFFFLLVGYWFENQRNFTLGRAVIFTLIGLLTFFCHIFSLAMACGLIAAMSACFLFRDLRKSWKGQVPKGAAWRIVSRSLTPLYALLPALLLAAAFRAGRPLSGGTHLAGWRQWTVWKHFLEIFDVVSYSQHETWCGIALAVLLAISGVWLVVYRLMKRRAAPAAANATVDASACDGALLCAYDGLLIAALALAALYFKFSNETAESLYIPERLMLFAVFMLLLWMAANRLALWSRRILWIVGGGITLALLALHLNAYRYYNQQIDQLVSASEPIRPGSTMLYLEFSPRGVPQPADFTPKSVAPFYMPAGYFSPSRHIVDLRNYEAAEQFFPVRFRPDVDPFSTLHTIGDEILPPDLDILSPQIAMPTPIDYVLIWGMPLKERSNPAVQKLYAQLQQAYVKIKTASDSATELWERIRDQGRR